ncbi:MAG: crossover junction endodeoxyribonuclease RuvC, partial [Devosia sp.]
MADMVRIIGIDPGLRRCGWGIIESEGSRLRYVACGTLTPRVDISLAERLVELHIGLRALIELHPPD